jgi:hypothetical protein
MKRFLVPACAAVFVIALVGQAPAASSSERRILSFATMAPVTGPFVGSANPIRDVNGGGLPWKISEGTGKLTAGGGVTVRVRGLVLLDGHNPAASFLAIVSCLTIVDGAAATVNVATAPFPATPTGDSMIQDHVTLPSPCIAPIVFVGPSATTWFSVTGQ